MGQPGVRRAHFEVGPMAGAANSAAGLDGGHRLPPILFVALSLDVGGAERHMSSVLPELVRRGWPVSIYCMNRLGAFAGDVAAAGVEVLGPPIERLPGRQNTSARLYATARAGARLVGVMRRSRPVIVHFFLPEPYLIGAPVALLQGVPICVMSRRGLNLYQSNWPGAGAIERRLHPHMTAVLGNSKRVVADLRSEGCRPDQIGLIYNGVAIGGLGDPVDRLAIRRSIGIEPNALVAIVVANLIPYKGHADILDALARIKSKLPAGMKLVCIGRDEGARASLEQKANELGLKEMVRFLGVRNDVAPLLNAADFSILASHEEGFSNAVIEAMAAGLPMVVSDVGGNAEAVVDGETGFVVPPRSPGPLGDAILRMASEPLLRQRFGAAGRKRTKDKFSLAASVDRYDTVYRALIAGQRVGDLDLD